MASMSVGVAGTDEGCLMLNWAVADSRVAEVSLADFP